VDTSLVRPIASPVVDVATPSVSSVLTFSTVPAADPNGVTWLTRKDASVTRAVSQNGTRAPSDASTRRYSRA